MDEHGNEVLNLGSFALLPQHVVRLILAREELRADEFSKFQAALMWSKKYCDSTNSNLEEVMSTFLEYIHFHMIPAKLIMNEIHPLALVDPETIMKALAYQADPQSAMLDETAAGGGGAAGAAGAAGGSGSSSRKGSEEHQGAKACRTGTVRACLTFLTSILVFLIFLLSLGFFCWYAGSCGSCYQGCRVPESSAGQI